MKRLTGRAEQRGAPLDDDCKKARVTSYEYGPEDKRKFCLGLYDGMSLETLDKCINCGAYECNANPLKN